MNAGRAVLGGALVLACVSCGNQAGERAPDEKVALGGSVAARVGGQAIPLALVEEVARAQKISAREAARKVIDDEIAASSARSFGLDARQPTAWNLVATRGRIVSDRIYAEARRAGPPTDAEVTLLSERHWSEVDRPPMVHVVHAIARTPKKPVDPEAAKAVARAFRAAALGATSAEDFLARAKAVDHPKEVAVAIEDLPQFASDGRIVGSNGRMDVAFAKAAHALTAAGATSEVVESSFGWHVIRLVERIPEMRQPFEERRAAFSEEVVAMRSHNAVTELTKARVARHPIEVSPAAESLMRSVPIASEQASNP